MTSDTPADPDDDGAGVSAALDAAIRLAFETRLDEPVPPELKALIERVRALEARARKTGEDGGS